MTSKEALEKICLHCEHYHQDMCFRAIAGCEEWHKLEKDLEVLEILKQLAKGVIELKNNNIDITKYVVLISESTNEKIKKWLDA